MPQQNIQVQKWVQGHHLPVTAQQLSKGTLRLRGYAIIAYLRALKHTGPEDVLTRLKGQQLKICLLTSSLRTGL